MDFEKKFTNQGKSRRLQPAYESHRYRPLLLLHSCPRPAAKRACILQATTMPRDPPVWPPTPRSNKQPAATTASDIVETDINDPRPAIVHDMPCPCGDAILSNTNALPSSRAPCPPRQPPRHATRTSIPSRCNRNHEKTSSTLAAPRPMPPSGDSSSPTLRNFARYPAGIRTTARQTTPAISPTPPNDRKYDHHTPPKPPTRRPRSNHPTPNRRSR